MAIDLGNNPVGTPPTQEQAEQIFNSIVPNTIELDYIITSDQTLVTIPDYAFSRKGEVPYFGNSPLVEGTTKFFDRPTITQTAVGATAWNLQPLALLPISEFVTDGAGGVDILMEIELDASFNGTGLAAGHWNILIIDNANLADEVSNPYAHGILYIDVVPDNPALRANSKIVLNLFLRTQIASATHLSLAGVNGVLGLKYSNDAGSSIITGMIKNDGTDIASGSGLLLKDTAATLGIYLASHGATPIDSQVGSVLGKIRFTAPVNTAV
jgi:hypothetical protein